MGLSECSCTWKYCELYGSRLAMVNPSLYRSRKIFRLHFKGAGKNVLSMRKCIKFHLEINPYYDDKDIYIAEHHFHPEALQYYKRENKSISTPVERGIASKFGFALEQNEEEQTSKTLSCNRKRYHIPPSFSAEQIEQYIDSLSVNNYIYTTNIIDSLSSSRQTTLHHSMIPLQPTANTYATTISRSNSSSINNNLSSDHNTKTTPLSCIPNMIQKIVDDLRNLYQQLCELPGTSQEDFIHNTEVLHRAVLLRDKYNFKDNVCLDDNCYLCICDNCYLQHGYIREKGKHCKIVVLKTNQLSKQPKCDNCKFYMAEMKKDEQAREQKKKLGYDPYTQANSNVNLMHLTKSQLIERLKNVKESERKCKRDYDTMKNNLDKLQKKQLQIQTSGIDDV